jgi:hypothetical protein
MQLGRKTQAWMLRHADPLQCPVGALMLHLMELLSDMLEDIDWANPDAWYAL